MSKQSYGSRRVLAQLKMDGYDIGRFRVRSLMRKLGLRAKIPRRYKATTNSNHKYPVVANRLERQFDVPAPNRAWTADITYVWTVEGWLYLAIVMDLFSRQIVGWAMHKRINVQLVIEALTMAYWRRKPAAGLLQHSDRGSQYASEAYQQQLKQYHMIPSMSRKADCWDNSPTERFFGSLKTEYLADFRFATRNMAKKEILERSIKTYEHAYMDEWKELKDSYRNGLINGMTGLEINVDRIEAKYKLSQNKSNATREQVTRHFEEHKPELGKAMRKMIGH